MKRHLITALLVLLFLTGLSLLLYPTVSNHWNELRQTRSISGYTRQVGEINNDTYEKLWLQAESYNRSLWDMPDRWYEKTEEYERMLDVSSSGIMGYIEIPSIQCILPIYHGTEEAVLQVGVGHLEGSSLPVGGEGTHCVLSGHSGLPSARLFTDLEKLKEGSLFHLRILDETLTYEVDQIQVVLPGDMTYLGLEEGEDHCTLLTCTPYGINSHRLLVRGHRIETPESTRTLRVTAEAREMELWTVSAVILGLIVVICLAIWLLRRHRA